MHAFTGQGVTLAFFLSLLVFAFPFPGEAQEGGASSGASPADLPLIGRLDYGDTVFRQYLEDMEDTRRRVFNRQRSGESAETLAGALSIYRYAPREEDDIFSLAARCNIPYAALATLNRLNHPSSLGNREYILLPSGPGIFVPRDPDSDIELLLVSARIGRPGDQGAEIRVREPDTEPESFLFYPGDDFSPTERIFFLNSGFRFPLRTYRLTSPFGMRQNPVTGRYRLHEGLDLAAPEGTEVFAARDGVVSETGYSPVYGNYVILRHGDNWTSLYGHLSKTEITLRQEVRSGSLIGRVGSTGQSTGPHLHFELRRDGQARDPDKYLKLFQQGNDR
ncbi:MAG: M23 family metallopeptidase [Treponema sp.]|jgi:murein DD-endopeptidase MepM/ murein hydrolase activator NlpD|nr:M23 family metallopeptidase [Treponema sp.]